MPTQQTEFQDRCARFGGAVLRLLKDYPSGQTKTIVASQLSSSATSIGANASEARSAESRADFIHKLQMALKEARESLFWLSVLKESAEISPELIVPLLNECDEFVAIMVSSVKTAKRNSEDLKSESESGR